MEGDPWAKCEFFPWNEGRRIVDLQELARQLHCKQCSSLLDLQRTEKEARYGLASVLYIHCSCGVLNDVHTGKVQSGTGREDKFQDNSPTPMFEINVKASINLLMYGVGSSHVLRFLSLLEIPVPSPDDASLVTPVTSVINNDNVDTSSLLSMPPALPSLSATSSVISNISAPSVPATSAVSAPFSDLSSLPLLSSLESSVHSVSILREIKERSVINVGGKKSTTSADRTINSDRNVVPGVQCAGVDNLGKNDYKDKETNDGEFNNNEDDDEYAPLVRQNLRQQRKLTPSSWTKAASGRAQNTGSLTTKSTPERISPRIQKLLKVKINMQDMVTKESSDNLSEEGLKKEEEKEEEEDKGRGERRCKNFDNFTDWSSTESEQELLGENRASNARTLRVDEEEWARVDGKLKRKRGSNDRRRRLKKIVKKENDVTNVKKEVDEVKEAANHPWCTKCCKDFNTVRGYYIHMKRVHNQEMKKKTEKTVEPVVYVCSFCRQPFARDYSVMSHLEQKHWSIELDPKRSYVSMPLKEVLVQTTNNPNRNSMQCRLCGLRPLSGKKAASHVCVDDQCRLSCVGMSPAGLKLRHSQQRLVFSSGEEKLCDHCGAVFHNKHLLDTHLFNAHGQPSTRSETYKCGVCEKSLTTSTSLRLHKESVHSSQTGSHKCHLCDALFRTVQAMREHRGKVHRSWSHHCPHCPKTYRKRADWKTHVLQHFGASPFRCEDCLQGFLSHYNLLVHLRIHTGEKPYHCPLCNATFVQKNSLDVHMRKHQKNDTPEQLPEEQPGGAHEETPEK